MEKRNREKCRAVHRACQDNKETKVPMKDFNTVRSDFQLSKHNISNNYKGEKQIVTKNTMQTQNSIAMVAMAT